MMRCVALHHLLCYKSLLQCAVLKFIVSFFLFLLRLFKDELTLGNVARPQLVSMCQYMGLPQYGTLLFSYIFIFFYDIILYVHLIGIVTEQGGVLIRT